MTAARRAAALAALTVGLAGPAARAGAGDAAQAPEPATPAIAGDPAYGEYLSGECTTCHLPDGAEAGIPAIAHMTAEDFVNAMHAYKDGSRAHLVMNTIAGRLGDAEIAALAAYFGSQANQGASK